MQPLNSGTHTTVQTWNGNREGKKEKGVEQESQLGKGKRENK